MFRSIYYHPLLQVIQLWLGITNFLMLCCANCVMNQRVSTRPLKLIDYGLGRNMMDPFESRAVQSDFYFRVGDCK